MHVNVAIYPRNLEPRAAAGCNASSYSSSRINMAESVSKTEDLVKKTGATSIIWTWFGFKPSDEQQKNILCRVCGAKVPAKRGNTTNLFYHLKTKHVV